MTHDPNCVFCKIVAGQIPSRKAYEDDDILVFHDINPWAPVHLLLIPKQHIATHADVTPEHAVLLGKMMTMVPALAREAGAANGFRTLINTGRDGGQEVYHLHMHLIGGARPWRQG